MVTGAYEEVLRHAPLFTPPCTYYRHELSLLIARMSAFAGLKS